MFLTTNKTKSKVDNFPIIRDLLSFPDKNSFYLIQIVKDNPDQDGGNNLQKESIAPYFIYSLEKFDELQSTIKKTCELEKATAFIKINTRNNKNIAHRMLSRLSELILNGNFSRAKDLYIKCATECSTDLDKKNCIEINWKKWLNKAEIEAVLIPQIEELQEQTGFDPFCKLIPTTKGLQIVTRPFLVDDFLKKYPTITFHLDPWIFLYSHH